MIRWLIVGTVAFLAGLLLYTVRSYTPQFEVSDELLVQEVGPNPAVQFLIPGGTEQLLLSSWCLVPAQAEYTPDKSYDYGILVVVEDVEGHIVLADKLRFSSRISGDPRLPMSEGRFSARLLDGSAWVNDARSNVIDTTRLAGRAGRVRLSTLAGKHDRVLVRVGRPEKRSELEREVLERSLSLSERRSFVSQRSALGFGDLPKEMRGVALAEWGRRLTAVGREGRDYHTRRLLLGGFRSIAEDENDEEPGVMVGPNLTALFNFSGKVSLRVHARPGTRLTVRQGFSDEYSVLVGQSGKLDVALDQEQPRTVGISAATLSELRFTLSADDALRLLGTPPTTVRGMRVTLTPDVRIQYYLALRRGSPVSYSISPAQQMLGLNIRSTTSLGVQRRTVALRWLGRAIAPRQAMVEVLEPEFGNDTVDQQPISDPQRVLLRVPPGAERLEVTGVPDLAVAAWTREPDVTESVLLPPYAVELPPNQVWRNAPYALRPVTSLRADEHDEHVLNGRLIRVATQVRIEELLAGAGRRVAERVLESPRPGRARRFFRRGWHASMAAFPDNGWTMLGDTPLRASVPSSGPRAQRLEVLYRVAPSALGGQLELRDGARSLYSQKLSFSTGRFVIAADPGPSELSLSGLGDAGLAFARVAPTRGGVIYQEQKYHELAASEPLALSFERRTGELLSILLFVASDDEPRRFQLTYRFAGAERGLLLGRVVRRLTALEGNLSGETNERFGYFWDSVQLGQANDRLDYVGRVRIPVGDDLEPGWYELNLTTEQARPGSLWVRAVIAGRRRTVESRERRP